MVAFLTLLLGLTIGVQRIELAVDHRVASVELLLDGESLAVLRGEPWVLDCDFGGALLPHHLEAIARDAEGRVLDRAVQRVNLPREAAEATLRLIGGDDGYHAAELGWRAADESEPEEIVVVFDGEPLEVKGQQVALPPHDRKTVHVLAAELIFANQVRARVELAFGGEYGEEVSSQLTAVPLEGYDTRDLPSPDQLEAWLRIGDQPARVVAVERGPREVIVVRDEASLVTLRSIGRQAAGNGPRRSQSAAQRMSAGIDTKDTLRLVDTHPTLVPARDGGWSALFPVTANVNSPTSGLGWALTNLFFRPETTALPERLAEAVGVAGLRAAASNRVRALVLVRSSEPTGQPGTAGKPGATGPGAIGQARAIGPPGSVGLDPANVRGFLAELRVPFFHWTVGPTRDGAADAWGESTPIRGWGGVHVAVGDLLQALRPQFLVWVDGLHKPGDVELAAGAPAGLRLAGAAPPRITAAGSRPSRRSSPAGAG